MLAESTVTAGCFERVEDKISAALAAKFLWYLTQVKIVPGERLARETIAFNVVLLRKLVQKTVRLERLSLGHFRKAKWSSCLTISKLQDFCTKGTGLEQWPVIEVGDSQSKRYTAASIGKTL